MEEERSFILKEGHADFAGEAKEDTVLKESPEAAKVEKKAASAYEAETAKHLEDDIPVDFSSFVLSLATSALIHLGEEVNPGTGQKTIELPNARQVIDLMMMLEEKTQGNLKKEEENLLRQLLYTLRMKYIALQKKPQA